MQATVTHRVTIQASAKEVFQYLSNPGQHHLWNPHLQSVSSAEPLKKGSKYKSVSTLLRVTVESTNIVTDYASNKLLEISSNEGPLDYCVVYRLVPHHHDTTQVICVTTVASSVKAFMYTRPVFKLLAQREIRADLRALKAVVEQKLD
jgi:uncharacterized membrane protein